MYLTSVYVRRMLSGSRELRTYIQYIREWGCVCFKCPAYTAHSLDARGKEGAAAMTNDAASRACPVGGSAESLCARGKRGGEGYLAPGPAIKSEGWRG